MIRDIYACRDRILEKSHIPYTPQTGVCQNTDLSLRPLWYTL